MNEIYAVITGLLLRIGIPILFTGGIVFLLGRLDARWQKEALEQKMTPTSGEEPCWVQKGCPPEKMATCAAAKSDGPCWQVFREKNGYLAQKCLDCEVFRDAPVPVAARN